MKQEEKNKLAFLVLLDAAMDYYQSFYREDISKMYDIAKSYDGNESGLKRKKIIHKQIEAVNEFANTMNSFANRNNNMFDVVSKGLSEQTVDKMESMSITFGKFANMLADDGKQLDAAILISLYNNGQLDDILNHVKENVNSKKEDNETVKESK